MLLVLVPMVLPDSTLVVYPQLNNRTVIKMPIAPVSGQFSMRAASAINWMSYLYFCVSIILMFVL